MICLKSPLTNGAIFMQNELIPLHSMGVSEAQIGLLANHLAKAAEFMWPTDPGLPKALKWMQESLVKHLSPNDAELLSNVVIKNLPSTEVVYREAGYDSCQSHRKLSKVVGEAILVGGMIYESQLLGLPINLEEAKTLVNSQLDLSQNDAENLIQIAKKHGGAQDFLFPGVTPTSTDTPSLASYAVATLSGQPLTSVRTITGVGGLRYDQDWNFVTDFRTFVKLKVTEDKRYYPGIGVFYILLNNDLSAFPALASVTSVEQFKHKLSKVENMQFQGVSILCSTFLPSWSEMKRFQDFTSPKSLPFAEAFHSPAYEFAILLETIKKIVTGQVDKTLLRQLDSLTEKLDYLWSFNSTIHLPWTANIAGLSNDLIGRITNLVGDYGIRYGMGYAGKSLEIRQLAFGGNRKFPLGLAGQTVYVVRVYGESDSFQGNYQENPLKPEDELWKQIQKLGFMKAGLALLEKHE